MRPKRVMIPHGDRLMLKARPPRSVNGPRPSDREGPIRSGGEASVADFSRPEGRLCIDGAFRDAASGAVCENINPATEEVIGQVADAAAADLDAAIGRRADS